MENTKPLVSTEVPCAVLHLLRSSCLCALDQHHGELYRVIPRFGRKDPSEVGLHASGPTRHEPIYYLMYVCPCIVYENDERYQLDATIYLLIYITLHVWGIYMPIFMSIRLYTLYTTPAYGVQHTSHIMRLLVSATMNFRPTRNVCTYTT